MTQTPAETQRQDSDTNRDTADTAPPETWHQTHFDWLAETLGGGGCSSN